MSFGYEAKCHKVSQALFKFNQGSGYVYSSMFTGSERAI